MLHPIGLRLVLVGLVLPLHFQQRADCLEFHFIAAIFPHNPLGLGWAIRVDRLVHFPAMPNSTTQKAQVSACMVFVDREAPLTPLGLGIAVPVFLVFICWAYHGLASSGFAVPLPVLAR